MAIRFETMWIGVESVKMLLLSFGAVKMMLRLWITNGMPYLYVAVISMYRNTNILVMFNNNWLLRNKH